MANTIRDRFNATDLQVNTVQCNVCTRRFPGEVPPKCVAFPGGIPEEIWVGRVKHDRPYPGDNGFRYREGEPAGDQAGQVGAPTPQGLVTKFTRWQCWSCKHLHRPARGEPTCEAFPQGIPVEIVTGQFDHQNPHEGDHGIQYEHEPRERQ